MGECIWRTQCIFGARSLLVCSTIHGSITHTYMASMYVCMGLVWCRCRHTIGRSSHCGVSFSATTSCEATNAPTLSSVALGSQACFHKSRTMHAVRAGIPMASHVAVI